MEALRIIKTINSDRLEELNRFKGKSVEIIILPSQDVETKKKKFELINELRGSCPNLPDGLDFQKKIRQEWSK